MTSPQSNAAREIEARSMGIVASLISSADFGPDERPIVMRIVHAGGDPTLASQVRFHPLAVKSSVELLRGGATLVADVQMTAAGINKSALDRLGCRLLCAIDLPEVARQAARLQTTRATAAMQYLASHLDGGVAVIGNAPTALREIVRMSAAEIVRPALVIGMPVGFVDAAESKQALMESDLVWITVEGTRGGSSLAAATVNALLRLACGEE